MAIILAPSASGKTTYVQLLAGSSQPVLIDGCEMLGKLRPRTAATMWWRSSDARSEHAKRQSIVEEYLDEYPEHVVFMNGDLPHPLRHRAIVVLPPTYLHERYVLERAEHDSSRYPFGDIVEAARNRSQLGRLADTIGAPICASFSEALLLIIDRGLRNPASLASVTRRFH